ncbi:MAG: DUF2628 domain-containing protein [Holosporales bacterium]|jgi:hypothetical protein|nr:DUF2628 domain-containing protein [Holosporales bacterium]
MSTKQEYYLSAFKELENRKKFSWNWAAFFFFDFWMLYRKMYLECLICCCASSMIYGMICHYFEFNEIFYWILCKVILGIWGNQLYYKSLKRKILKGYHLIETYKTTLNIKIVSIVGSLIAIFDRAFDRTLGAKYEFDIAVACCYLVYFIPIIVMCVYAIIQYVKDKKALRAAVEKTESFNNGISEENLRKLI